MPRTTSGRGAVLIVSSQADVQRYARRRARHLGRERLVPFLRTSSITHSFHLHADIAASRPRHARVDEHVASAGCTPDLTSHPGAAGRRRTRPGSGEGVVGLDAAAPTTGRAGRRLRRSVRCGAFPAMPWASRPVSPRSYGCIRPYAARGCCESRLCNAISDSPGITWTLKGPVDTSTVPASAST